MSEAHFNDVVFTGIHSNGSHYGVLGILLGEIVANQGCVNA